MSSVKKGLTSCLVISMFSGSPSFAWAAEKIARLDPIPVSNLMNRAPASLTIAPGQAEIIRYVQEPGTVIIGDAEIAVASIAASDILILTGLRTGVTNVIVLDDDGIEIDQISLRVALPGSNIIVRRALERQVLRCNPLCAPTEDDTIAVEPMTPVLAPVVATQAPEASPDPGA